MPSPPPARQPPLSSARRYTLAALRTLRKPLSPAQLDSLENLFACHHTRQSWYDDFSPVSNAAFGKNTEGPV